MENSQSQLDALRAETDAAKTASTSSTADLEATRKELDRALPFEKEVKEKNLLIGKLRHEAVILNDHLTKALRFLKRGKPEDNVDRQIVTNHFLHFLMLDRSDPKKFQVLQLIAALLGWTEGAFRALDFVFATGGLQPPIPKLRLTLHNRTERASWTGQARSIQLGAACPPVAVPSHAQYTNTIIRLYARECGWQQGVSRGAVVRVPGTRSTGWAPW